MSFRPKKSLSLSISLISKSWERWRSSKWIDLKN